MGGESQLAGGPDRLDRAVFALKVIWFGLFAGAVVIAVMMAAVVMSGGGPRADLGEFGYAVLTVVPLGLFAAYFVVPMLTPRNPVGGPGFEGWDATTPDEPYHWFPLYQVQFFLRAGLLEGPAILCAVVFLITAEWAILGGSLVMIAALAAAVPTRSKVEAFADAARQRRANAG